MLKREAPIRDSIVFEVIGLEKSGNIEAAVYVDWQGITYLEQQVIACVEDIIDVVLGEFGIGVSRCYPTLQ